MFRITFRVRQGSILSSFLFAVYLDDLAKSCDRKGIVFIILYADDKLLLAPSLSELDNLFRICERELNLLQMAINFKKSAYIRIGHGMDARYAKISSSTGSTVLPWCSYNAVTCIQMLISRSLKSVLSSSYAIFGIASEEVVLQLVMSMYTRFTVKL